MEKTYIHCSALSGYFDCPRRNACAPWLLKEEIENAGYKLRDERKGIGATIGTSVHAGANEIIESKIDGEVCNESQSIDRAMNEYTDIIPDTAFDTTTPNKNTGEKQVIRQTKAYYHIVAPNIIPIIAEKRYTADLGSGFFLSGKPDVITENKILRDTKCGSVHRDASAQCGAYAILMRANILELTGLNIDFIKRARITKPQPAPEEFKYLLQTSEKTAWYIIHKIIADIRAFRETKNPWSFAANPMSMLCSEKYCTAFGTEFCEYKK